MGVTSSVCARVEMRLITITLTPNQHTKINLNIVPQYIDAVAKCDLQSSDLPESFASTGIQGFNLVLSEILKCKHCPRVPCFALLQQKDLKVICYDCDIIFEIKLVS